MNIIPINELYCRNYSLNVINALRQDWKAKNSFSCIGSPKRVNILLYLNNIKAEYITPGSQKLYVESGDIVYAPIGCEYKVRFFDGNEDSYTIGINFFSSDNQAVPFIFSRDILIFKKPKNSNYKILFSKTDIASEAAISCPGKMKAGMYDIVSALSELSRIRKQSKFDIIMKGIAYLENVSDAELNLKEVSNLCNVSTSYFRRLFKEYANVSPKEYVINNKIEKAKLYIEYENFTVSEIAERLNFTDSAYFSKQFKRKVGMSPSEYKRLKTSEPSN